MSDFLSAEQPADEPTGETLFETSVAVRGGVMTIEVIGTPTGPVLMLRAAGGLRKPAPIRFDRFQAEALRRALSGASDALDMRARIEVA